MAITFLFLMSMLVLSKGIDIASLKLDQVVILSRHNVRTPLTASLKQYSAKKWPTWNVAAGYLTEKGALLEEYMGKYFAEWLDAEEFFEGCPEKEEVFIYANTKPRTIASAQAFAKSAFPSCNVSIHLHENLSLFDPLFLPILHQPTEEYKKQVAQEMKIKLKEVNLRDSYTELSRIIKLSDSDICKKLYLCDLMALENEVVLEDGEEPNINGPLFIGNEIVDSFIMSFYEGMPEEQIGWGEIKTPKQWSLLTKISRENQNVRFNLTSASKDIAGPLLKHIFETFVNGTPKFALLMGHDSNLNPVVNALGFKPFDLPNQYEPFPIGGKLVFQKWIDKANEYLKIEYIYPSFKQLRNADRLSLSHPPQKVLLELNECKIGPTGFCPWDDFMRINEYT